jgi:hypothetical protein
MSERSSEAITLDNFGDIADLNWTNSAGVSTDHFDLGWNDVATVINPNTNQETIYSYIALGQRSNKGIVRCGPTRVSSIARPSGCGRRTSGR